MTAIGGRLLNLLLRFQVAFAEVGQAGHRRQTPIRVSRLQSPIVYTFLVELLDEAQVVLKGFLFARISLESLLQLFELSLFLLTLLGHVKLVD